jgi:hypothetical protein
LRHDIKVVIEPEDGREQERAVILVGGLALAAPPEEVRLMLREDLVEGRYLSLQGWRGEAFWLPPTRVEARAGKLALILGPDLRRRLVPGAALRLGVSFDRRRFVAAERFFWPDPSRPAEAPRRGLPKAASLTGAAALLLALVAAGGWLGYRAFWPLAEAPPLSEAAAKDRQCRDEAREILARESEPGQIRAEAERFRRQGQTGCAFLLFKQAAGQGDEAAQTEMGRMYDPRIFDAAASPLPEPDPEIAAEWYEKAAETGYEPAIRGYQELMNWLAEKEAARSAAGD